MPKIKDDRKEEKIYSATLRKVIKTGFSGLKMADVASEANMATGTVYIYFKNKEELINTLYFETKKEIAEILSPKDNLGATFYETFKKLWYSYFDFCLAYPEKMLFVEQFIYSGFIKEDIKSMGEAYFQDFNSFISESQKNLMLKNIDIEILKAQLTGPIHETIKITLNNKITLSKTIKEQCFEMAWQSVRL